MTVTKRIAIATDEGRVSEHFGRCCEYTIADVDVPHATVVRQWLLPSPGHEPDRLPQLLADNQVGVVIAGGMGPRAQALFGNLGIACIVGASGTVDSVIKSLIDGALLVGAGSCEHVTV